MKMPLRIKRDEKDKIYPKTNKGINFDENKDLCAFVQELKRLKKTVSSKEEVKLSGRIDMDGYYPINMKFMERI